jgi:tight adherence protein B
LPLEVALEKLATRIPLLDVHFFVSAVLLQKRTGGNLAEVLE